MSFNIEVEGGKTVRLTTAGKYCDRDIVVTAKGAEAAEHTWNQIPTAVKNFLDNVTYDPSDYSTSQIANYAPSAADVNNTYPIGITVETESGVLDRDGYEMAVQSGNTTLYNDIPNQHTEFVNRNNGAVLRAGTLKPTGALRQIKCATSNVRDLGGWTCDGGTVKYGKLFRGGEFQAADVDIFINQLGIRHELNLRGSTEAEEEVTVLRDYVGFTCPEKYVWYVITDAYKEAWKEIIRCAFDCAMKNKPLYFHCSAGADRTGTVACILEALLGMSQSDIDKDYELTCFALGVDSDEDARRRNESEWSGLVNQINELTGSSFRDKVINWVASLGFTADEINAYRTAMIDGTPDVISLNVETYTITNTIGEVETDNATTTVNQYRPYEAELTAPKGYAFKNIKVTMGGTDVTASVFKGYKTTLNRKVVKNLTNCSLDNARGIVIDGQGYVANLTADEGFTLEGVTVTITMGGVDMAVYYSEGKIAIPNVTGDIVITATAVESAQETLPVTIITGYRCNYSVGQAIGVTEGSSYAISEEIPVEYGKTYTMEYLANKADFGVHFVGYNNDGTVTEMQKFTPGSSGTHTAVWTPTVATTNRLRLRGYASSLPIAGITELKVS
jgi:protein-tyrosine phosphatase